MRGAIVNVVGPGKGERPLPGDVHGTVWQKVICRGGLVLTEDAAGKTCQGAQTRRIA